MTSIQLQFITIGLAMAALPGLASADALQATLRGDNEAPPVDSRGVGNAVVTVTPNGVNYKLIINGLTDIVAAHIHCAPEGVNGPVGVTLFGGAPFTRNGVAAEGPLTQVDQGNGCGWSSIEDMVMAAESGGAYVNVHTLRVLPGEIRGQLR